jgi:hypothetical protein
MKRTVAHRHQHAKDFLTSWTCRLTNRNGPATNGQNGFEINLCIVSL